jgi:hydroxymethylpyrimidine/phosphomethylpyrimidine kinase
MIPVALTIAGSDSGGGAGIQADLRVFSRLGVFGTTVVSALTAQNLEGVTAVHASPASFVAAQLEAVLAGFPVAAAKTGMLWSRAIIERVAAVLAPRRIPLVVDPVMVATSGARLLEEEAVLAYRRSLFPLAALATPNLDEAAVLLGREVEGAPLDELARALEDRLGCPVLLKGGHLAGDPVDTLCARGVLSRWSHRRVDRVNSHGSGCLLSAAIAAWLAAGRDLRAACDGALRFTASALASPHALASGARLAGIERARVDGA